MAGSDAGTTATRRSTSRLSASLLVTLVLVVCFVRLPAVVAGLVPGAPDGAAGAGRALGPALTAYWEGRTAAFPDDLQTLVDYWMVWHATKVAIATAMVVTLALAVRECRPRSSRPQRRPGRWAGVGASVGAALALGLLVVNVQATAAPSIALLPLLSTQDGTEGVFTAIREQLASGTHGLVTPLSVLLADTRTYHLAMVLAAGTATVAALVVAARRRVVAAEVLVWLVAAAGFGLLLVNSVLALVDPSSALLDLVGRG